MKYIKYFIMVIIIAIVGFAIFHQCHKTSEIEAAKNAVKEMAEKEYHESFPTVVFVDHGEFLHYTTYTIGCVNKDNTFAVAYCVYLKDGVFHTYTESSKTGHPASSLFETLHQSVSGEDLSYYSSFGE